MTNETYFLVSEGLKFMLVIRNEFTGERILFLYYVGFYGENIFLFTFMVDLKSQKIFIYILLIPSCKSLKIKWK